MKILFIQPTPYYGGKKLIKKPRLYFLGLAPAILAALVPEVEMEICLETIDEVNFDTDADLIAISSMGHGVIRTIDLAKAFKARGKTVVLGGYMVSLMPEEAKKYCDSVVIGDGERSFVQLIADYRRGELQPFYNLPITDLSYPPPRYDLLAGKRRTGDFLPVQAGRGCPNSCSFCSVYCLYRGRYHRREIAEVIRDVKAVKALGYNKFLLLDDNILSDRAYTLDLCAEIKKLGMLWMSQCAISIADDPELLAAVRDSGCVMLSFGIESISQESLNAMQKGWAKADRYAEQIKKITEAGIDVSTEMVVGGDGDTLESIRKTADFIIENRIVVPRFYILTPIPGTVFHEQMLAEDRIVNTDIYSYNGAEAVHRPKNLTPEALTAAYWQLYKRVFRLGAILRRTLWRPEFFRSPGRYLFYFYVNLYYKYQIDRGITPNII